ncbi:MAG: XRE family transcriptional regulator [Planctomycetota bacterium]
MPRAEHTHESDAAQRSPTDDETADQHHDRDSNRNRNEANLLGRAIREERLTRRLTLQALAERSGCARSYLSAIENGHRGPPSDELLTRMEAALSLRPSALTDLAAWERTPRAVRDRVREERERGDAGRRLVEILSGDGSVTPPGVTDDDHIHGNDATAFGLSLDEAHRSGELRAIIDRLTPATAAREGEAAGPNESNDVNNPTSGTSPVSLALPREIPVINRVAAGYPTGFTDLGYPARSADEYIRCVDVADVDAFAARVVGDSMEPEYREGDVVVFSPARDLEDGCDCFARFELGRDADAESTFKRVYFETDPDGHELIRLQPINNRYAPTTVPRERIAGLYRAVSVTRRI